MSAERGRSFFISGGTLPPDSASYLERNADRVLLEALLDGRFCYVLNSRQSGKSSLSVHTISRLRGAGIRTASLDMTRFGGKNLTAEQWYTGLAMELGRELGCRAQVLAYWQANSAITPVQRLFGAIREVMLGGEGDRARTPLVIFIDEIDATRSLPFDPDEFYAAIRECFNRRVSDPGLNRLAFCLLGVAVPSDLIRNRATTPFNIGERIQLEDFSEAELSAFAPILGPKGPDLIARVRYWTAGHPFLSQTICRSMVRLGALQTTDQVDEIVRREMFDYKARESNINLADVGNIALHYVDVVPGDEPVNSADFRANLLSQYQRILDGRIVSDDESSREIVLLKLSGLVRSDGRRLYVRNRIYEHVFDRVWIEEHMPDQELRRQRQSFRRGAMRAAAVAGGGLAVLAAFAVFAWRSRLAAVAAEQKLSYQLYVADMNSLRLYFDNGDTGQIESILRLHQDSPYRGFEWGFWMGRVHDSNEEYTLDYRAPGKREEGHISSDGRQICLVDFATSTATLIDRATKRSIATVKLGNRGRVVALQRGWAQIQIRLGAAIVRELLTGRTISKLGDPGYDTVSVMSRDHSDFVLCVVGYEHSNKAHSTSLWDAATGQCVFRTPSTGWSGVETASTNGKYLLISRPESTQLSGKSGRSRAGAVELIEVASRKVLDRFPTDEQNKVLTGGFDGRYVMYGKGTGIYIRDVQAHQSQELRPPVNGDWIILRTITNANVVVTLLDHGRCVVNDFSRGGQASARGNVFAIAPGEAAGQYIASSNTVRLYDEQSSANGERVARGTRITRFSPRELNVFGSGTGAIRRIDSSDFHSTGSLEDTGNSDSYTYSGRWVLSRGAGAKYDVLSDTLGIYPRFRLPFAPSMWSCGGGPESIACWDALPATLVAYSGPANRVRWTYPHLDGVKALWVSPDGSRVITVQGDRDVKVFDMATGALLGSMNSHNSGPIYVTFTADGRRAFTCGGDGRAVMWDLRSLKKVVEFRGNEQAGMTGADLSPDGRRVVTTSESGEWHLWDASNGVHLLDVQVSPLRLSSAIFCADGRRILTAGDDGNVRLWTTVEKDPTTYIPIDPAFLKELYR